MVNSIPFGARSTADKVLAGIDLTGKRMVVTGCNSGIGFETMNALSANGAQVIGLARSLRDAEIACAKAGPSCSPIACDLADLDSAAATESRSARSQAMGLQEGPALAQAISASRSERARPITWAPLALRAFIVSKPIPELQPVTTMRLPVRSMPASTLSAVERAPNGIELTIKLPLYLDLIQRRAEHARRDRHPLHEFFSRYRTLFETSRGGMQRARQIRRRHAGPRAKAIERRLRDGAGECELELSLVVGESRPRERSARAHEIRGVRAERAHEAS